MWGYNTRYVEAISNFLAIIAGKGGALNLRFITTYGKNRAKQKNILTRPNFIDFSRWSRVLPILHGGHGNLRSADGFGVVNEQTTGQRYGRGQPEGLGGAVMEKRLDES